jgi:2-dehydro-3-deoxyphosphogalactonate aldolase
MTSSVKWPTFKRPLVAILRGVRPEETAGIVDALVEGGFEAIEIPLNSPEPFRSVEIAAKRAPAGCLVGAGTVLSVEEIGKLADAGGRLMVSPNVDAGVIRAASEKGMVTMPGVFTATEALLAASAGASALKFFPAGVLGPSGINAIRAVLPKGMEVGAVGGVSERDFDAYAKAGIRIFGLGSSLYKPGETAAAIGSRARAIIAAYDAAFKHAGQ